MNGKAGLLCILKYLRIFFFLYDTFGFNPLTPGRTLVAPFTEISIPFKEGIIKKFPMSVAPMSR